MPRRSLNNLLWPSTVIRLGRTRLRCARFSIPTAASSCRRTGTLHIQLHARLRSARAGHFHRIQKGGPSIRGYLAGKGGTLVHSLLSLTHCLCGMAIHMRCPFCSVKGPAPRRCDATTDQVRHGHRSRLCPNTTFGRTRITAKRPRSTIVVQLEIKGETERGRSVEQRIKGAHHFPTRSWASRCTGFTPAWRLSRPSSFTTDYGHNDGRRPHFSLL